MYSELPPTIQSEISDKGCMKKESTRKKYVAAFLKRCLPENRLRQGEDEDLKHKAQILDNARKVPRVSLPPKKKKTLTAKEKRKLKLFEMNKEGQNFAAYLPLHNLWKDYMADMLQLSHGSSVAEDKMNQVLKADFHGCYLTVKRSKCPSFVGNSGIVLQETRNTFRIITNDNKVKCLPKANSVFVFEFGGHYFTIYGNHLRVKAADRSVRKFKSRSTVDL